MHGAGEHELTRRAQLRMVETIDECLKHPNEISEAAGGTKGHDKGMLVSCQNRCTTEGRMEETLEADIERFPEVL